MMKNTAQRERERRAKQIIISQVEYTKIRYFCFKDKWFRQSGLNRITSFSKIIYWLMITRAEITGYRARERGHVTIPKIQSSFSEVENY